MKTIINKFQLIFALINYAISFALIYFSLILLPYQYIKIAEFLGIGVLLYFSFILILKRYTNRKLEWFRTFTHELIHVIFIYLSGNEVQHFYATKLQGGFVKYTGKKNILISLSPYFFPIYPLLLIFISYFIENSYLLYIEVDVGFVYAFQLHTFYLDSVIDQSDFIYYGRTFSISFISMMNLLFLLLLFCLLYVE